MSDRLELFVGGGWQQPRSGEVIEVMNPATGELVGRSALAGPADLDEAVGSARASFDSGVWSEATPQERSAVLHRAADLLEARSEELADSITAELGCPIWFSRQNHVPNPIRHLRYYADLITGFDFDEVRGDGSNRSLVTAEPVGVVGAITPWNGPLSTPTLKVAPALAAGCSVVLKPPPETPLTVFALADAFAEAGLPAGVLNVLPGDREAGQYLVEHPEVDKVAFTGSSAAGKQIMATAAARIGRVTLELGGKSAAIVLPDAEITSVVARLLPLAMLVNGQACIAQTRVLVHRSRQQELTEALAAAVAGQLVGNPADEATRIGPLVSERQRDRVAGYIALGQAEGAKLATPATLTLPEELASGWFVPPTVFAEVDNSMRIAQEEIFGPVLTVIGYDTPEEAVAIANRSVYGLSGSVWGTDTDEAQRIARRVRTGMISINGVPQAYGSPFGGYKQSGVGREMGPEGFRAYLETKSIALGDAPARSAHGAEVVG